MKKYLGYVVTAIITLILSVGSTVVIINNQDDEVIEKTVSEVAISETDTIKTSIDKVYNSAVVIENYYNNTLVSSGSGFVYKKDSQYGYILTNNHVVENARTIKVIDNEGQEIEAELMGADTYMDIAVLRIKAEQVLSVASIGDSSTLQLGDTVFAVGAPVGRKYVGTVTKGIVSGKNRQVTVSLSDGNYLMEVIQTDTAINPGNSGGPLVNINGEVVGINSMKLVKDEIEGMGFAIPIEEAMIYVDRLEKGEEITRPVLGIEIIDVQQRFQLAQSGLDISDDIDHGIAIYSVNDDSIADQVGLKSGDVITKIDNQEVSDLAHFRYLLYKHSVGDKITITYNRDGKDKTIDVKL